MIYLPIIFIVLAAMFKAVSDTLSHHFDTSIFRRKDRKFWDASLSWKYAKTIKFTGYKWDAWHISNSLMIIAICLAIVFHKSHYNWIIEFVAAGGLFTISFNTFYNHILR